jgi:opacity protein-like surface antigen
LVFSDPYRSLLVIGAIAMIVARGDAQEGSEPTSSSSQIDLNRGVVIEMSPHTGVMGKSGVLGIRASMNYSSFNMELAGEQVIGKNADLYLLSLNGLLNLTTRSRLIPYGAVGVGLFITTPTDAIGDETVTTLGVGFGGGARYYITRSFGARVEVKQYMTSVESDRTVKNELLFFQEITLGITFMFQ